MKDIDGVEEWEVHSSDPVLVSNKGLGPFSKKSKLFYLLNSSTV